MITPTNPSSPSHGPSAKLSDTSPIGASFDKPTISPALITPHKLSPTINPDATSVPNRSARSGFASERVRRLYQTGDTAPAKRGEGAAQSGRDTPPTGGGGMTRSPLSPAS